MLCGIDEAGRGPLAGPVCAAAVILPAGFPVRLLNDSKKLGPEAREEARRVIVEKAVAWGVGWATHVEIDDINILQASLLAMRRAFECLFSSVHTGKWPSRLESEKPFGLPFPPGAVPADIEAVVDGIHAPDLSVPGLKERGITVRCGTLVKADATVREVMAASILAKTARDQIMDHYHRLYPQYGYDRHKGYPTPGHRKLILEFGPSPIRRKSFRVRP